MFSAKNYGLPKDLIEAAKKVHEKQLEENLDKSIKKPKNKDPDFTKLSKALNPAFEKIKKQTKEDLKSEEVQFTEEELAEAFAIFLEENFHVEMLTEEDLDYVFENEFPQWLEENRFQAVRRGIGYAVNLNNKIADYTYDAARKAFRYFSGGAKTAGAAVKKGAGKVGDAARQNPVSTAVTGVGAGALGATAVNRDTGSDKNRNNEPKDADESDFPYADSDAKKSTEASIRKSIATAKEEAKKQASQAKPTPTARKQVKRSAPKPQSFGALLRKVGGNAPATTATAAGRRKVALLDARARARTAARDARVRRTRRGQLSFAKAAFEPKD